MIEIFLEERHQHGEMDISYPVIICDFCGRRIKKIRESMYYWDATQKHPTPYYVHASPECAHGMDRRHGRMASMPLPAFFIYLFVNSGFTDEDLRRARELTGLL